jgi:hypothetical protein
MFNSVENKNALQENSSDLMRSIEDISLNLKHEKKIQYGKFTKKFNDNLILNNLLPNNLKGKYLQNSHKMDTTNKIQKDKLEVNKDSFKRNSSNSFYEIGVNKNEKGSIPSSTKNSTQNKIAFMNNNGSSSKTPKHNIVIEPEENICLKTPQMKKKVNSMLTKLNNETQKSGYNKTPKLKQHLTSKNSSILTFL